MNNPVLTPRIDASEWEPKFPFDLVVAYEDSFTRNRALHLYDHLAQQLLDDYDFQCSWWKFDHLTNLTLRQQAADAAVEANMIILSMHARPELPSTHRLWMENWIPRRDNRKAALVALVAGENALQHEAAPMLACLQNAARLGKMDFFTHEFNLPAPEGGRIASSAIPTARLVPPIPHHVLEQRTPTPRWGINE
jgi:hypothetical protein